MSSLKQEYLVYNWSVSETTPPCPGAVMGPIREPNDSRRQEWTVRITPDEIVALSDRYDVMIVGQQMVNDGTKKKPIWRYVLPTIMLDVIGRRFRESLR